MRISLIGSGNVATHLSLALKKAGYEIAGIYSRTLASAQCLARYFHCKAVEHLKDLPESDIYIFAVKDAVLADMIAEFGHLHRKGLCMHTAGSVPMSVFHNYVEEYGVLYPLQTFSKQREISFSRIPLFVEGNTEKSLQSITNLASLLSDTVYPLSSDSRKLLHLAAVFACNFSNHCFAIAGEILKKADLPEHLLVPLINETCQKLKDLPAVAAQTGPAVRYDKNVMAAQMELLGEDLLRREIYQVMSKSIHEYAEHQQL